MDPSVTDITELLYSQTTSESDDSIINKIRRLISESDTASTAAANAASIFNNVDSEGYTLLEHAIAAKRTKVVRFLADRGAKLAPKSPAAPSKFQPELSPEQRRLQDEPIRSFLKRHNWPYTSHQDGVIAFLAFSLAFAVFGILHLTNKAWPTLVAVMLWVGMTLASPRNREFMKRIIQDFLHPPSPSKAGSTSDSVTNQRGQLVVFEGPDNDYVTKCVDAVASVLEDKFHLRVRKAVWSKDRVPKFLERTPGARRPRGFTDKYTRKDKYEKGDIFIVQPDLGAAELADRDTMGFAEQFVREIRPALEAGSLVLVSHYWYNVLLRYKARGGQQVDLVTSRFSFAPHPDVIVLIESTQDSIIRDLVGNKDQWEYLENAWKYSREVKPGAEFDDPFPDVEENIPCNFIEAGLDSTYQRAVFGSGRQGILDALRDYFRRLTSAFSDITGKVMPKSGRVQLESTMPLSRAVGEVIMALQNGMISEPRAYYQHIPTKFRILSFFLLVVSLLCTVLSVLVEIPRIGSSRGRIL